MKRHSILRAIPFIILALTINPFQPARASTFWYVSPTGNDSADCLSDSTPCRTIHEAIDKAASGDYIVAAAGTYSPSTNGESFPLIIDKSLSIHGNHVSPTIVDVEGGGQNAFEASGCGFTLVIGDFTIQGAEHGIEVTGNYGNCIQGEIMDNVITGNGTGLDLANANTNIRQNDISGNTDYGINNYYSTVVISRNIMGWNGSGGVSAAVYNYFADPSIVNNVIGWNNGSGIYNEHSSPTITNNTISWNYGGSGIANFNASSPAVTNNIVTSNGVYGIHQDATSLPTLTYNDAWGNAWGDYFGPGEGPGSISHDPLFVSALDGHLQSGSPAINHGNNSAPLIQDVDFNNLPRIVGGTVDMGAYEYQSAVVEFKVYLPTVRR